MKYSIYSCHLIIKRPIKLIVLKKLILLFTILFLCFHAIAQDIEFQKLMVTGKIIDINGLPLIGAQIIKREIPKKLSPNLTENLV